MPLACAVKVTVSPTLAVCPVGCWVMAGPGVTVSEAGVLVTAP